jgi:hydroxyacylglutathione hydrolase
VREVADGLWQIPLAPRAAVNAYLVGDVLVDAGTSGMGKRLPEKLGGRSVTAHMITHAHQDHVGGSKAVCEAFGVELWAPAGDADDAERGKQVIAEGTWAAPLLKRAPGWAPHPVARRLVEGDEVAGFRVINTPGHSPGHVSLWREADRALIVGDVFFNNNVLTMRPGLREPIRVFTVDPARNRHSMRRLAALGPSVAVFGHGPPLDEAGPKLEAFASSIS